MFRISARVRTAVAGFVPIREPGFRPPVDPATPAFDHRGNPIRCGPPRRHRVLAPGAGDAFRGVQGVGPSHRRGCTLRGGPTRARAHSAGGIWRPNVRRLRSRVRDIGLQNVAISLGKPHDPRLPTGSVDIAILVHMYHEISQPYALLYNLVPALKPDARVGIVLWTDIRTWHAAKPIALRTRRGVGVKWNIPPSHRHDPCS
jgi:hypothetical protein